ncbi:hypothetical protein BN1708_004482 [Verticillium longisporum]|uniref:Uncharacterized protein n=1 Tax=Verticillium longisporum TaxID=100787 RepID=A0A0G4M0N3_VERLO|nr:hypothetical protein BN1708_004482 [Verticillium longisporum]
MLNIHRLPVSDARWTVQKQVLLLSRYGFPRSPTDIWFSTLITCRYCVDDTTFAQFWSGRPRKIQRRMCS